MGQAGLVLHVRWEGQDHPLKLDLRSHGFIGGGGKWAALTTPSFCAGAGEGRRDSPLLRAH